MLFDKCGRWPITRTNAARKYSFNPVSEDHAITRIHHSMSSKDALTPVSLRQAINALPEVDLVRLKKIAQWSSRRLCEWGWEDLLHEAVRRALEGTRACPSDVPLITFLVQTMRSLAQEQWAHERRSPVGQVSSSSLKRSQIAPGGGPERELAAAQELSELRGAFAKDAAALAVLDGMAEGDGPGEIQARAGLDLLAYRAAQKRIRRAVLKLLKEES